MEITMTKRTSKKGDNIIVYGRTDEQGHAIYCAEELDKVVGKFVCYRSKKVQSICLHDGELLDANENGIYSTISGELLPIIDCAKNIRMRSIKEDLYYSQDNKIYKYGEEPTIFRTMNGIITSIYGEGLQVKATTKPDEGGLYHSGERWIVNRNNISDESTQTVIKEGINGLLIHEGRLYDYGTYGLRLTATEKEYGLLGEITAACSVPRKIMVQAGVLE